MIIVGTCSPDYVFPATACVVQHDLGATKAGAFDIEAACTSFVSALAVARGMIVSGAVQNAVVIGAETLSRFLNWNDRTTCVLFGDGAGAVVLEATNASVGVESVILHSDGAHMDKLLIPAGGARIRATQDTLDKGQHLITMQGGDVFKLAVKSMADAAEEALAEAGLGLDDIALMIPHQANIRIIEQVAKRLHFPMDRVFVNIQRVREHLRRIDPDRHLRSRGDRTSAPWRQGALVAFGADSPGARRCWSGFRGARRSASAESARACARRARGCRGARPARVGDVWGETRAHTLSSKLARSASLKSFPCTAGSLSSGCAVSRVACRPGRLRTDLL